MSEIRVAIVGTGFGVRTQLPGLRAAGGYRVVSLTGSNAEKTRRLATEHGVPHALTTIEDAIEVGDPELVCITTPPHLHLPMGLAALSAGAHVLLEKPMALCVDEAARLAAAAGATPGLALIDHELRALPDRQEVARRVAAGDIGPPLHAFVRFASHGRAARGATWSWFASRAAGGGMLGAIGSHIIDMLEWWLGEISHVRARLSTSVAELPDTTGAMREVETDDGADLLVSFKDGGVGTISISAVASAYEGISWEIHGREGTLRVSPGGRLFVRRRSASSEEDLSIDDGLGTEPLLDGSLWARGFVHLARDLAAAIRTGRPIPYAARFANGHRTQRVIDAARTSDLEAGRQVTV